MLPQKLNLRYSITSLSVMIFPFVTDIGGYSPVLTLERVKSMGENAEMNDGSKVKITRQIGMSF